MTNVIELPQARDARHPADQPNDETMKRVIDAANRAWHQGGKPPENVQEHQPPAETPPSVRTIARNNGIDLKRLLAILGLQRPAGSNTEEQFVDWLANALPEAEIDGYGNVFLTIGENPNIMWSCHTDTVARDDGHQNVKWQGDKLVLNEPKQGQCLGADDGAGLWLLLEMIDAKVPGLYIFHREEEIGGKGSHWLAANHKGLLDNIKMAIAFDRRDVDSVITHQGGQRTCSEKFAKAIAEKFNQVDGLRYTLDPGGSFTDTKSYVEIIPECTNISVGYYSEHSARESLDVAHLLRLREALISYDFSDLPVERDPKTTEWDDDFGYGRYASYGKPKKVTPVTEFDKIHEIVKERAFSVAKMLHNMGMKADDLEEMIFTLWQRDVGAKKVTTTAPAKDDGHQELVTEYLRRTGQDEDIDDENVICEEALWCNDCGDFCDPNFIYSDPQPGDGCPQCFQSDTELIEVEVDATTGEVLQ